MNFVALFAFITIAAASSLALDSKLDEDWENFKNTFGKKYDSPKEEMHRRMIWEENVDKIIHHNLRADLGLHKFRKGINEYSDLRHSEFLRHFNVIRSYDVRQYQQSYSSNWTEPLNVQIPDTIDWRTKGLVTPVKNQGICGSCWAFSATGALEGHHKLKTGKLVPLSVQNLVDCAESEGNNGCDGGYPKYAFEYVKKNNGISKAESYPYTGLDGDQCLFKEADVGATCTGYVEIPSGDEDALKKAVGTVGPVSVNIDSSHEDFHFYKDGIYDELDCSTEMLNHAVLIVGYGTDNGNDYWLVKNSAGTSWGIDGYIKMSRNLNNQCGIASMASYPLV